MDIVSRALALPIPLPADYVRSLPRIPKDFKVPKRVCRDIKISPGATNAGKGETFTKICKDGVGKGKGSGGEMMILIVLMGLCMCCCCSIISTGTGGFLWWKKRKESEK
jgi:hypothetical protein